MRKQHAVAELQQQVHVLAQHNRGLVAELNKQIAQACSSTLALTLDGTGACINLRTHWDQYQPTSWMQYIVFSKVQKDNYHPCYLLGLSADDRGCCLCQQALLPYTITSSSIGTATTSQRMWGL